MKPISHKGYRLLHEGTIALSQVEAVGMRVDEKRLDQALAETQASIKRIESKLQTQDIWRTWRKRFADKSNLYSHEQLGVILYDVLKYPVSEWTGEGEGMGGRPSTDVTALEKIDLPFVRGFVKLNQLDKANGTYLTRIKRSVVNGRFHPNFDLHTVQTYRSSSDFQNVPVRDPFVSKIVRSNFIASEGNVLVENDYVGAEVRIAACYHQDPVMIDYIKDTSRDMHGDMAAQIYFLLTKWIKEHGKNHRYGAKNRFVFPQFYGDYYVNCAKALWEWMERAKLEGPDGIPLRMHLKAHGISKLGKCDPKQSPVKGTFEKHIQEVEEDFWNNRFSVYGKWKKRWYNDYLEEGGFDTLTGFRIEGVMRRNEVINYPVQGSAFHCLLWALIRINKLLRRYKMKARVVSQVHDSLLGDVPIGELKQYLDLVKQVMTEDITRAFRWLIVPLDVENEICAPNGTWYDKQEVGWDGMEFSYKPKGAKGKYNLEDTNKLLTLLNQSLAEAA